LSIQVLLDRAKAKGLNVSLEGSKVKVRASREPEGEAKALIAELRQHKAAILEALTQKTAPEALADSQAAPACWNCEAMMTETMDICGRSLWVCWLCAKTI